MSAFPPINGGREKLKEVADKKRRTTPTNKIVLGLLLWIERREKILQLLPKVSRLGECLSEL